MPKCFGGLPENSNPYKKFGRNQPCPCGSGKKYKYCHGANRPAPLPMSVELLFQRKLALEYQREQQQGLGKPIISEVLRGERFVAVGNKIYRSTRWKTFYDFLWDFILQIFGNEWFQLEEKKPKAEQHPVFQWHCLVCAQLKPLQPNDGKVKPIPTTGAVEAYFRLAYHLYLVSHNGGLPDPLLIRLKQKEAFRGAEHELYVAATFNKAGFTIEFEDETDETRTHCEYTVTHKGSGKKFSVEAKARNAESALLRGLLTKALAKQADHTRLIWFAINFPATEQEAARNVLMETLKELRSREGKVMIDNQLAPPAYVVVSNNSYSLALDSTQFSTSAFAEGFQIPDFKFDRKFPCIREMRLNRDKHKEIHDLFYSLHTHDRIPITFDGEDEIFAFGGIQVRLLIGNTYEVPDGDCIVHAILESATVNVSEKLAYGFYRTTDGKRILVTCPLSDEELRAYHRIPQTFFGVIDFNAESKARDPLELFDWMYKTYRKTPKEKLLEFFRGTHDEAELNKLSQDTLAIIYCERHADSIFQLQNMADNPQATGPTA